MTITHMRYKRREPTTCKATKAALSACRDSVSISESTSSAVLHGLLGFRLRHQKRYQLLSIRNGLSKISSNAPIILSLKCRRFRNTFPINPASLDTKSRRCRSASLFWYPEYYNYECVGLENYTSRCWPLKYNTCLYYEMAYAPYFYFKPK
jgi:hypothetical protein